MCHKGKYVCLNIYIYMKNMKVQDKERLERDDIKECWHKNVTTCYDSYVTEFTSAEEEECEDVFYKNCVIDFKQVPFEYDIKSCLTPMIKVGEQIMLLRVFNHFL